MSTRRFLALAVVCAGTMYGTIPGRLVAQDAQPAATDLYQQGIQHYEAGDLDAARQVFRRVDPMQLPRQERVRLYRALQEIDRRAGADASGTTEAALAAAAAAEEAQAPGSSAAEMLAQADEVAASDLGQAASLYRQVIDSPTAGESLKAVANARLAESQRRVNSDVTEVRRQLDLANADLEAGDTAAAQSRLQTVRQSGVALGWFDQQRLDRLSAAVAERDGQATAMAQPAPADDAVPAVEIEPDAPGAAPAAPAADAPAAPVAVEAAAQPAAADPDLMDQYVRLQARQAVEEGRAAEDRGEINLARERYRRALQLDPNVGGAAERLADLESRRGGDLSPRSTLEQQSQALRLERQRVTSEYEAAMNAARAARDRGDFAAAVEHTATARVILDRNERILDPQRYAELRGDAEALSTQIAAGADEQERLRLQREATERGEIVAQQTQIARQREAEEVNRLLLRARELQKDQRYDEALQLVNQAMFLDPTNLAVQMMRDILEDSRIFANSRELLRRRDVGLATMQVENIEATIPYTDLITYPSDWPQLTDTRLQGLDVAGGESEMNRRVAARLQEPIPVDFNAARLENVLEYFRNVTGINVFVNWSALETAGVERDTVVTLQLSNVPAEQALRLVLQQAGAQAEFDPIGYSIIEGIVTISTQRDLQRTTDLRPYDIRDLLVEIPNFDDYPEFDLSAALEGAGDGGGGDLFGGDTGDDEDEQPTRQELVEQITTLIQDTVGRPEEWQAYGGDVSSVRELNGQLIIKTTPDNHRQISLLLSQLRETRAIQISVEARFLLVDQNFLEEIGFDLDVNWTDPGGNFGPISLAQDSIGLARRGLTTLSPGVLQDDDVATSPGQFTPGLGYAPTGRALDLGITYLDDLEVNLIVNATQFHSEAISLTAPRVTFFNGQQAYVLVVRQIAFVSDLEPVPDAFGFDIEVEVVQSGAILVVQGTVSADRRYVTMTLQPSLARVQEPIPTFPVLGVAEDDDDDDDDGGPQPPPGVSDRVFEAFIQLPTLELTQVKATVSVPDRGTLLIGGQRLVAETEVESGVPVLSKIPVINRFFTNNSTVKDSRTLLILIRPTIIIQGETEQQLFPGLQQAPGAYNVGG